MLELGPLESAFIVFDTQHILLGRKTVRAGKVAGGNVTFSVFYTEYGPEWPGRNEVGIAIRIAYPITLILTITYIQ